MNDEKLDKINLNEILLYCPSRREGKRVVPEPETGRYLKFNVLATRTGQLRIRDNHIRALGRRCKPELADVRTWNRIIWWFQGPKPKGSECRSNKIFTVKDISVDRLKTGHFEVAYCSMPCCQVIYSQFGLAIHPNDHPARRRFVEWAQNEIAVVPDFHKRILFSDEAHFWLNGYVNKQNCRIWSEANPQVYVETLHSEKLTVWCALWAGGILLQKP
ncbi:hypothetical protein TNCV_4789361 [Trichonephila clavipes]|nr:hypothetical protein TNCV_4789361 [Trichonephila clavipes]